MRVIALVLSRAQQLFPAGTVRDRDADGVDVDAPVAHQMRLVERRVGGCVSLQQAGAEHGRVGRVIVKLRLAGAEQHDGLLGSRAPFFLEELRRFQKAGLDVSVVVGTKNCADSRFQKRLALAELIGDGCFLRKGDDRDAGVVAAVEHGVNDVLGDLPCGLHLPLVAGREMRVVFGAGQDFRVHVVRAVENDDDIDGDVRSRRADSSGQKSYQHHACQQHAQETFAH